MREATQGPGTSWALEELRRAAGGLQAELFRGCDARVAVRPGFSSPGGQQWTVTVQCGPPPHSYEDPVLTAYVPDEGPVRVRDALNAAGGEASSPGELRELLSRATSSPQAGRRLRGLALIWRR